MGTVNDKRIHIASNRKAIQNYEILSTLEAGLILKGSEIKSIRERNVSIANAFVRINKGEAWLVNAHVATYSSANIYGFHDPLRTRKLLLHRREIDRLIGKQDAQQNLTIIPLSLYISKRTAKVEIALARGLRKYDRREIIKVREAKREMSRAMKRR